MPKLASAFTQHTVVKAHAKDKPYELRDGGCRGLILRVQPTGSKIWYVTLPGGRRHTLGRAPAMTLTQAREYAKLTRLQGGLPQPAKDDTAGEIPTLGVFLETRYKDFFAAHHERAKQHLNNLRLFDEFMSTRIDLLSPDMLDRWVARRLKTPSKPTNGKKHTNPPSKATIRKNVGALKTALKQAAKWKIIPASPLEGYQPVKNADVQRERYLTPAEEKKLRKSLRVVRPYFRAMILLGLNTGMRRGELFKLTWKDVDFKNKLLMVRAETAKSRRVRHIPMNEEAIKALQTLDRGEPDDAVFPGRRGKFLNNTAGPWRRLLSEAGVQNLNFHDLRHTFASKLVQKGIDLYTVQKLLGHSDPKLTARYAHLAPDYLRKAVEVL